MKLHEDLKLLEQAIRATSQYFKMAEIYVEKDYWITLALYLIFHSDLSEKSVFKGGTALSKCHGLIERFSEGIDISVLGEKGESGNQLAKKMKTYYKIVGEVMPEVKHEVTHRSGKMYKTVHSFSTLGFDGDYGQVRKEIIIEATWLGCSEPYTIEKVSSYITDMLINQNQSDLIEKYTLQPFKVKVLSTERTFCEKIMSFVRFSRTEDTKEDLKNKVRHMYDLHILLQSAAMKQFFNSKDFDDMLNLVAEDDKESFKNSETWTIEKPSIARIFNDVDETWKEISYTYNNIFGKLVFGSLPPEADIKNTLKIIHQRLIDVNWMLT